MKARFSGARTADALIEELVGADPAPADLTVVTSDRPLQHAVRYARAQTLESGQFAALLYASEPVAPPEPRPEEKPTAVPPEEVEELLRRFEETDSGQEPEP